VPLDGAGADEQLRADFLVGAPIPGQLGDLSLLGSELGEGFDTALAHGLAGGQQLPAGAFRESFDTHRSQHLGWLTTSPEALPDPLDVMILGEFEPEV